MAGNRWEHVPAVVQRYLDVVLGPMVQAPRAVRLEHRGTMWLGNRWRGFSSHQRSSLVPPQFRWQARVRMMPAVWVDVLDSFEGGRGTLQARLWGILPVTASSGAALDEGEYMRWCAEAAWYPWVLADATTVDWQDAGGDAAVATFRHGALQCRLTCTFATDGTLRAVEAATRPRAVGTTFVPTPWRGEWQDYRDHHGILIPTSGQVSYIIDGEQQPYWRGTVEAWEMEG